MSEKFDMCVKRGGKVITRELGGGKYMHLCKASPSSKWIPGEVKMKKEMKKMK